VKSNDAKYNAISRRQSDYFGFKFKLSEKGSVLSVENVHCMTCQRPSHITSLIYHLQRTHDSTSDLCVFIFKLKLTLN